MKTIGKIYTNYIINSRNLFLIEWNIVLKKLKVVQSQNPHKSDDFGHVLVLVLINEFKFVFEK